MFLAISKSETNTCRRAYHRHVVSKRVFGTMDHWIWERLWHWCRRRHPKKNGHWIADRYFVREGTRGWVFQASRRVVKGRIVKRPWDKDRPYPTLRLMSDTKIKRHTKVKQDANPYDAEWEMYFEQRTGAQNERRPARQTSHVMGLAERTLPGVQRTSGPQPQLGGTSRGVPLPRWP